MRIKIAKSLGYCMGVRRAMDMAFKALEQQEMPFYSHGPLIHNRLALELLEKKGLKLWSNETNGSIIIRAHGLSPQERDKLENFNLKIYDATCPRVVKIHKIVKKFSSPDIPVIIWGSSQHPEVIGIKGFAPSNSFVVSTIKDIENLPAFSNVLLVSQSTQSLKHWPQIVQVVNKRWPQAIIKNTICEATENRQKEVLNLSSEVDALLVIGGKNSGNTQKLAEIGQENGLKTLLVETPEDLQEEWLQNIKSLGITAGASTPNWQIKAILQKIESFKRDTNSSPINFFKRFLRALVFSSTFIGLGAGALAWVLALLENITPPSFYFGLFFFYIQSMHLFNAISDIKTARFSDPDRLEFILKYKNFLLLYAFLSILLAFSGAWLAGSKLILLLIFLTAANAIYSSYMLPRVLKLPKHIKRLKDLPLSKNLLTSLAWAILIGLTPVLFIPQLVSSLKLSSAVAFLVFINILCRSIMLDILENQRDYVFGRNNLPTILGIKKTINLLYFTFFIWLTILLLGYIVNLWSTLALYLIVSGPIYNIIILKNFFKNSYVFSSYYPETILDLQFIFSGLIGLIWLIVS